MIRIESFTWKICVDSFLIFYQNMLCDVMRIDKLRNEYTQNPLNVHSASEIIT